ncbi:MAG: hypothetical protein CFE23_07290 [Flavobacterium sp. BFFFF1]|uniref:DUF2851 family protein n=1 Tax=unclassified Flavobacterium TaxID=196869 RepID=UPI000BCC927A|nr:MULTISPECIES: DUF2851 family protein [unclassified Flavobacterium]OYU80769.1 MAG: hypothetical protein CFE23_07290 [Flavobacterium sp. BFFFF1]
MKEDFLHYLWRFKKFPMTGLKTTSGDDLQILNTGQYPELSGPDFFNAQIILGQQKWAGNIEIHLKSSDWYLHHHHHDAAYDNVILHVVWEHDSVIFRKDHSELPTLALRHYIPEDLAASYRELIRPKSWIYCEKQLCSVDLFTMRNWMERLFINRMERKSEMIDALLIKKSADWEGVFFCLLAKNFGLNTNGQSFLEMAESLPFGTIRKEHFEVENLEALFFGRVGLLEAEKQDQYFLNLKSRYHYLTQKYRLNHAVIAPLQFFKHRPDNFPTIRLAQLAMLYQARPELFSSAVECADIAETKSLFDVKVSDYWQTHYQFDRESPPKKKALTTSFVDLLILNTLIPVRFAYAKRRDKDIIESLIACAASLPPETNAIVDKFKTYGLEAQNAFESQALLELKTEYCNKSRCLQCAIGAALLKPG